MSNEPAIVENLSSTTLVAISTAEIDMQISTARRFPRVITQFRDNVSMLATLNDDVAAECTYSLPRDGKTISGPSARFAEIIASAWGNCRYGARIVGDDGRFITAQGYFHDLQGNVAVQFEVRRPITTRKGFRFSDDMIGVTGNAAASIALRNAVLKGVPKALWADLWERARKIAGGDERSLAARRVEALRIFSNYGVSDSQVFQMLGVRGTEDINLEHLMTLRGLVTAFKEGDTTPDEVFAAKPKPKPEIEYRQSIDGALDKIVERGSGFEKASPLPPTGDADGHPLETADVPEGALSTHVGDAPSDSPGNPSPERDAYLQGRSTALAGATRAFPRGSTFHYKANKGLADEFYRGYDDVQAEITVMP